MCDQKSGFIPRKVLRTIASLVIFVAAAPAWAALGGDISSIQADQVHLQSARTIRSAGSYAVHEMQAVNGILVREYATSDGKVFAVTFQGPWMPDMRQLLGSYFEQFARAAAEAQSSGRAGRHPVMIDEPGLTVQISGRPRSFAGKAYVPEMLPTGLRGEDLQ